MIKVGVRFPPATRADQIAEEVRRAERHGFDVAWIADSQLLWRDVYAAMAVAATRTERIALATAVTNVVTRHPTVVASGINTVAELAPGRVILGLGTGDSSVKPMGVRPSKRAELRAAIEQIRALLGGGEWQYGERRLRLRDAGGPVPVHIAASGPRTLELAGEIADGVVTLAGISPETLAQTRQAVLKGVESRPQGEAGFEFTVGAFCKVTEDLERDAAVLKPICLHMATIGGQDFLRIAGIDLAPPPHVPEVYPDMVHAEDWELAIRHASKWVTDEMAVRFARTFCLFGTVDDIVERARRAVDLGATGFYLRHVGNYTLPSELIESFGGDVLPRLRGLT
ncbi:LLM class flavin-dependent oxidoreductase [Nonomuraea sp. NPDC046802]|uniref:LLM class flavin-dependent oxidoreductase n=1 Tax=Nonomuraea sp. NPDC046802 TaxID=3154919 RepID=UPI0034093B2B